MENQEVRFKDIVKRNEPDFIVRYKLAKGVDSKPFQGFLISLTYEQPLNFENFFCDVYPEFKTNLKGDRILPHNEFIPESGYADMWLISESNLKSHKNMLKLGAKCYFLNGQKLIAECEVVAININCETTNNNVRTLHNTTVGIHDMSAYYG